MVPPGPHPFDSRDSRISSIDVPMVKVRVHVITRGLVHIEQTLKSLPLHALVTHDGVDVSGTVVRAVLELERLRTLLQAAETA